MLTRLNLNNWCALIFAVNFVQYNRAEECVGVISEINTDGPSKLQDKNNFIEIRFTCPNDKTPDLEGYSLVILKPYSDGINRANCELFANLARHSPSCWKEQTGNDYFLILADSDIKHDGKIIKPTIGMTSDSVRSRSKFVNVKDTKQQSTLFDYAQVGGRDVPHAIILLRTRGHVTTLLNNKLQRFSARTPYVPLDEGLLDIFKNNREIIKDIIVYGKRTHHTSCTIFNTLCPDFSKYNDDYILREWDGVASDYSLSYCGDPILEAKRPDLFKRSKITPGAANDCSGTQATLSTYVHNHRDIVNIRPRATSISQPELEDNNDQEGEHEVINESCRTEKSNRILVGDRCISKYPDHIIEEYQRDFDESQHYSTNGNIDSDCLVENDFTNQESVGGHDVSSAPQRIQQNCAAKTFPFSMPGQLTFEQTEATIRNKISNDRKRRLTDEANKEEESVQNNAKIVKIANDWWDTTEFFDVKTIEKIRRSEFLNSFIDVNWFTPMWEQSRNRYPYKFRTWLEINYNQIDEGETIIMCRICNRALLIDKSVKIPPQKFPKLANGVKVKDLHIETREKKRDFFLQYLQRHVVLVESGGKEKNRMGTTQHANVIKEILLHSQIGTQNSAEIMGKTIGDRDKATQNMFNLVYAEIKLNIPFMGHEEMVQLIDQKLGADIGRLHITRQSAVKIASFISSTMHEKLVRHLCTEESQPFSLIIDGTSDKKQRHYLITYIRAMEITREKTTDAGVLGKILMHRPVTYFYKLILMEGAETAEALMQTLKNEFEGDNKIVSSFSLRMKNNLIGFGSDGAAVNLGKNNGLITKLKTWTDRKVIAIHCMAHRLQLAIGYAWKKRSNFKNMETFVNAIYSFLMSERRRNVLEATTDALEEQFYELNYIFAIRWVASESKAMKKIFDMFSSIYHTLDDISNSDEFDKNTREKSKGYLNVINQRNFLSFLAFFLDILNELAFISKKLQSTRSIVVNQANLLQGLKRLLNNLKTNDGKVLSSVLRKATCGTTSEELVSCETLENFETSGIVMYNNIKLEATVGRRMHRFKQLSDQKEIFLQSLIDSITDYYPDVELHAFDVFDIRNFPNDIIDARSFKIDKITNLATYLGYDSITLADQWQLLVEELCESELRIKYQNSGIDVFWSIALGTLNWENKMDLKRVIQLMLVLPVTSSDAERGFSILKHVRYDRRSRLGANTLDLILRLRINGPSISNFRPYYYVREWLKRKNCASDAMGHKAVELTAKEKQLMHEWEDMTLSNIPTEEFQQSNIFM